jgi:hypothetical protein
LALIIFGNLVAVAKVDVEFAGSVTTLPLPLAVMARMARVAQVGGDDSEAVTDVMIAAGFSQLHPAALKLPA